MSSYCYVCVLILLYAAAVPGLLAAGGGDRWQRVLLYICVRILLYVCYIFVSAYCYLAAEGIRGNEYCYVYTPQQGPGMQFPTFTSTKVQILTQQLHLFAAAAPGFQAAEEWIRGSKRATSTAIYVSSYCYICVLLLHMQRRCRASKRRRSGFVATSLGGLTTSRFSAGGISAFSFAPRNGRPLKSGPRTRKCLISRDACCRMRFLSHFLPLLLSYADRC